jgi:hypothetical protein
MSYDPSRIKRMNESNYKKDKGVNYSNNLYSRKRNDIDMHHFIEKNNSFCGDINNYGQILLGNENSLNSLRLNLFNNLNNFQKYGGAINYGGNFNSIMEYNNNLNYCNKTAEKLGGNNSLFMLNRLTTGDRANYNNFMKKQDFNRSMNMGGINLNTDFNNYNINNLNMIDNNTYLNKINQYPNNYNYGIISPFNNNINQTNLINLFNNNYLNFNTIQNKGNNFIQNYNLNNLGDSSSYLLPNSNTTNNVNKNNSASINIEDIIILQEKLNDIIIALNKTKMMANECFEFLNFYYNSSIYCYLRIVIY